MTKKALNPLSASKAFAPLDLGEFARAEKRSEILHAGLSVLKAKSWKDLKCGLRRYAGLFEESGFIQEFQVRPEKSPELPAVSITFINDPKISAQFSQIISKYARHAKRRGNSTETELGNMPEIFVGLHCFDRAQSTTSIYLNAQNENGRPDLFKGNKNVPMTTTPESLS